MDVPVAVVTQRPWHCLPQSLANF